VRQQIAVAYWKSASQFGLRQHHRPAVNECVGVNNKLTRNDFGESLRVTTPNERQQEVTFDPQVCYLGFGEHKNLIQPGDNPGASISDGL
jgi:hypothetical protein